MIIGFLGKGGSGKSTVSTKCAKYFHQKGFSVLAIDADHNMDLSYNLGAPETMNYIGTEGVADLYEHIASEEKKIRSILEKAQGTLFSLKEKDAYTKKYTTRTNSGIEIMSAGPQNERVFRGDNCSHSLASPLKIFLPLLKVEDNEVVVVDEKASVDAVTTGIPCGFHLAVIVVEPAIHSIKAGKQIAEALTLYEVPYIFVGNKIRNNEDRKYIEAELPSFGFIDIDFDQNQTNEELFKKIHNFGKSITSEGDKRLARAQKRFHL